MEAFDIVTDDTLKATIQHGTVAFPFEYYLDEIHKFKNQCIEWHWHNEFEFTSVLTGPVNCLIGTNCIMLNSGDGLFINSGTVHRFESHKKTVMISILFSPEFIANKETTIYQKYILPLMISDCKYIVLHKENDTQKHYLEILNSIYIQAKNQYQMRELEILILTASLWKQLLLDLENVITHKEARYSKRLRTRLQIMLNYIQDNYKQHLSLDEIAASANISRSEALRSFHLGVQTTPVNYLNEYRLIRAKEQLLSTSDTVSQIAWNSGFESVGYFCRMFKKKYNQSPGALRKQSLFLNK